MKPELTVNDIKQYFYCKRVVFFNRVMSVDRKPTYKMEHGRLMEEEIRAFENRRKLRKYNLDQGIRLFYLGMTSERLGLSGKLDMLIISAQGYFPVDFKYSNGYPNKNHHYQLGGYALLIEEKFGELVKKGFIYLIPRNDVVVLPLTERLKGDILKTLDEIRSMIIKEIMPAPVFCRNRCLDCEFRNYCGDVF
jgi:CRISPR-associated exonuclease Cas4